MPVGGWRAWRDAVDDLVGLTKPTITLTTLVTCAGGFALAGTGGRLNVLLLTLIGTGLVVGSANAFNMVLERDIDARMRRTCARPLPSRRLSTTLATVEASLVGVAGFACLYCFVDSLTAGLALASLITYAFIYTPLKRFTPWALVIGAIPGAAPPLLGWTAAVGRVDPPGLALFLVLFVWQLPHFLAIALRCRDDYARAGIRAVPVVHGEGAARRQAVLYSALLIPTSLLLPLLGVAGWCYAVTAVLVGTWMLSVGALGLRTPQPARWDHRLFIVSLVYLPTVMLALAVDISLR